MNAAAIKEHLKMLMELEKEVYTQNQVIASLEYQLPACQMLTGTQGPSIPKQTPTTKSVDLHGCALAAHLYSFC